MLVATAASTSASLSKFLIKDRVDSHALRELEFVVNRSYSL
jgi:hypothetical protein